MTKLLKANFYKLIKEKSFYILLGIAAFTALSTILLYYVFGNVSEVTIGADTVVQSGAVSASSLFLGGANLGQNLGIIISFAITIYLGKEFSQNTIRNKITIGYSKTKIYLSNLIASVVISGFLFLTYQFFIVCVAVPMFGWSENGFVFAEFIRQLVNSLCILIAFSAVLNMVCMFSKNMVAGIIISIVGVMLGILLFSGIQMIPFEGGAKTFVDILVKSNFLGQSTLIASTNTVSFMIWCIVSAAIITAGSAVLGSFLFAKMDIK